MYRVTLPNATAHRTCTPLYEKHTATPYGGFLDPAETSMGIYSGMVMTRTGDDTYALMDGNTSTLRPFGLSALDRNLVVDDFTGFGTNAWTVWFGGPDALFTITAPAFDVSASPAYAVPTTGRQYLYAGTGAAKGMLTTAGSNANQIVAELWSVVSATKIVVRLIGPGATAS